MKKIGRHLEEVFCINIYSNQNTIKIQTYYLSSLLILKGSVVASKEQSFVLSFSKMDQKFTFLT